MTTPSPTALLIASLIENALVPIFATMSAPLTARIDELEKAGTLGEPTLIEKVRLAMMADGEFNDAVLNQVLASDNFDSAVLGVINDRPGDVIENLGDDLTDKIKETRNESLSDTVAGVIRGGSFNIDFNTY